MSKNDMSEAVLASSIDAVSHSELLSYADYLYLCDVSNGGCFSLFIRCNRIIDWMFAQCFRGCLCSMVQTKCVVRCVVQCVQNRPLTILTLVCLTTPNTQHLFFNNFLTFVCFTTPNTLTTLSGEFLFSTPTTTKFIEFARRRSDFHSSQRRRWPQCAPGAHYV
jgi:hypothetical protein